MISIISCNRAPVSLLAEIVEGVNVFIVETEGKLSYFTDARDALEEFNTQAIEESDNI